MPRGCAGRTLPGGPRPPAPRRPAPGGGSARGLRRAHSRPGSWPWLGGLWRARKGATVALAVSPTLIVTLGRDPTGFTQRSEEHTSELQSLMRISYAVFCFKKQKQLHY